MEQARSIKVSIEPDKLCCESVSFVSKEIPKSNQECFKLFDKLKPTKTLIQPEGGHYYLFEGSTPKEMQGIFFLIISVMLRIFLDTIIVISRTFVTMIHCLPCDGCYHRPSASTFFESS